MSHYVRPSLSYCSVLAGGRVVYRTRVSRSDVFSIFQFCLYLLFGRLGYVGLLWLAIGYRTILRPACFIFFTTKQKTCSKIVLYRGRSCKQARRSFSTSQSSSPSAAPSLRLACLIQYSQRVRSSVSVVFFYYV
jgi:hypothetical protein